MESISSEESPRITSKPSMPVAGGPSSTSTSLMTASSVPDRTWRTISSMSARPASQDTRTDPSLRFSTVPHTPSPSAMALICARNPTCCTVPRIVIFVLYI